MTGSVLVVGDTMIDVIAVLTDELRVNTDSTGSVSEKFGGAAANTACWLGYLGVRVNFVSSVAALDVARHVEHLEKFRVTPHLAADPSRATGRIVVLVRNETRTMITDRGANNHLDFRDISNSLIAESSALYLTGYSLVGENRDDVPDLIARARSAGLMVALDPASSGYIDDLGPERFLQLVTGADIILPNEDEATTLTRIQDPLKAAQALTQYFPVVVLTRGPLGCAVFRTDAPPLFVRGITLTGEGEPTGAGDAFAAAYISALLDHKDHESAARQAVEVGSAAVKNDGGQPPSYPVAMGSRHLAQTVK